MSNKLASLDALTRFWTNTKTYIQKYVSSFVNNKLSNFIQKNDIINSFTSTDATKVAAAPTVKTLNDNLNQLNMNLDNLYEYSLVYKPENDVTDALQQTIDTGIYSYSFNATNAPSPSPGIIMTTGLKDVDGSLLFSLRIALTTDNELYTSIYQPGISWGTWEEK